jgi:hypothetical protein
LDLLQRGWQFQEINLLTLLGTLRDDLLLQQLVLDLADVAGLPGLKEFDLLSRDLTTR